MSYFLPMKKWQILTIPSAGVSGNLGKIALATGIGAVAGATILGTKTALEQQQQQKASTSATTGGYQITVEKGGTAYLSGTTTGTATAQTEQEQKQQAEQKQPDYMQYLIIGGLIIGAIMLLKRK